MKELKKGLGILLLISLTGLITPTQAANLDSLRQVVEQEPDTLRLKTYGLLAFGYLRKNTDSAQHFAEKQLALAQELNNERFIGIGYSHLSLAYKYLGDYELALEHELKSLQIARETGTDRSIAISLSSLGNLYKRLGSYDKAQDFFLQAIEIHEKSDNKRFLVSCFINYSNVLDKMKRHEEAIVWAKKASRLAKEIGLEDSYQLAEANIGASLIDLKRYEEARPKVEAGLAYSRSTNDKASTLNNLYNLGLIAELQFRFQEASQSYTDALSMAETVGLPEMQQMLMHDIARVLGETGQFKEAFTLEQQAYRLRDSLFETEIAEALAQIQGKFEVTEKDLQISLLKEVQTQQELENTRLWVFLGGGCFLALIGGLAFLLYRQRQQARWSQQQEVAKSQQLRAALAAEEQERSRIAGELHDSLGQLLSTTKLQLSSLSHPLPEPDDKRLAGAISLLDESVAEVRQISHNLAPPALIKGDLLSALRDLVRLIRKTDSIKVHFEANPISPKWESWAEIHLYRIIQELINNSIKHAGCSEIGLTIASEGPNWKITVWDNGKGFELASAMTGKGLGWHSLLGRLQLLSASYELSSSPLEGTSVSLLIPETIPEPFLN